MPFDGVSHRGARLVYPYPSHPESVATGAGLSSALAGSYMVSRFHASNIGTQNFFEGVSIAPRPAADYFVDYARWRRHIPADATHIMGTVLCQASMGAEDGTIHHRIKITVGGATDTGETVVDDVLPSSVNGAFSSSRNAPDPQGGDYTMPAPHQFIRCFVEINNVTLPSQSAVITLSAFALDGGGRATTYFPKLYTSWWACNG